MIHMLFFFFNFGKEQGQGLCVVTVILEGKLEEVTAQASAEKVAINTCYFKSIQTPKKFL